MQATRLIGTVLPNGNIALPKEFIKKAGKVYEIILIPVEEPEIYTYCENIAKEKKIPLLSESALANIIHASRKVK